MKKSILAAGIAIALGSALQAQKEVKYSKLFYKDIRQETGDVTITVDNAVSTDGETKFKLKITNKTSAYLIYKPEESKFTINGKDLAPKEKWLIIKPNESDFRIINLKGAKYNAVKSYAFVLDGLYSVAPGTKDMPAPDFKLPAAVNDFKAGDFTCAMSSLTKETGSTDVKFKCVYNGSKIGFIDPSKVAVKMPDGNEYANTKTKAVPLMVMKGTDENLSLGWDRMQGGKAMDMQKVPMVIIWHNAFTESDAMKMSPQTLHLEFDEALSNEKGK